MSMIAEKFEPTPFFKQQWNLFKPTVAQTFRRGLMDAYGTTSYSYNSFSGALQFQPSDIGFNLFIYDSLSDEARGRYPDISNERNHCEDYSHFTTNLNAELSEQYIETFKHTFSETFREQNIDLRTASEDLLYRCIYDADPSIQALCITGYSQEMVKQLIPWLQRMLLTNAYAESTEFKDRDDYLDYLLKGEENALYWLYLINPIKFVEFSVLTLNYICDRLILIGAKTDLRNDSVIKELGYLRVLLRSIINISFFLPVTATRIMASPHNTITQTIINYLNSHDLTKEKSSFGRENPGTFLMGIILALYLEFSVYSQLIFFFTVALPAVAGGMVITSPAMMTLLFGANTLSGIGYAAANSFGLYIIPTILALQGYSSLPSHAAYHLDAKLKAQLGDKMSALIGDADLYEKTLEKIKSTDKAFYEEAFIPQIADFENLLEKAYESLAKMSSNFGRKYDWDQQWEDQHQTIRAAHKRLVIAFHPDKNQDSEAAKEAQMLVNKEKTRYEQTLLKFFKDTKFATVDDDITFEKKPPEEGTYQGPTPGSMADVD